MNLDETIGKIDAAFSTLKETKANLVSEQKRIDKEINDHYHVLEMITMNASQISKVVKGLRGLLKSRRDIKESLILIESILTNHDSKTAQRTKRVGQYESEAKVAFNQIMEMIKNG